MRIGIDAVGRVRNTHFVEHRLGLIPSLLGAQTHMQHQHFGNLMANGLDRIERAHRILKDRGDVLSAQFPQFCVGQLEQVNTSTEDLADWIDHRVVRQQT